MLSLSRVRFLKQQSVQCTSVSVKLTMLLHATHLKLNPVFTGMRLSSNGTGIGYFTLPYLVHAGATHVHACEWNPTAVEALRRNLQLNKVSDRCTVHQGDNRKVKHFKTCYEMHCLTNKSHFGISMDHLLLSVQLPVLKLNHCIKCSPVHCTLTFYSCMKIISCAP